MRYLRDKLRLKGKSKILTVRIDDESMKDINMLSDYLNLRKGEIIKLGIRSINIDQTKKKLLNDAEEKMKELCGKE